MSFRSSGRELTFMGEINTSPHPVGPWPVQDKGVKVSQSWLVPSPGPSTSQTHPLPCSFLFGPLASRRSLEQSYPWAFAQAVSPS